MATDILYVVGGGASKLDNRPLKWSIASVRRFGKNVGRIVVAGMPPKWLPADVIRLYVPDVSIGKHWNILHCIGEAIRKCGLDKPFLYSSDDHYLCREADMDAWPRYYKGECYTFNEYFAKYGKIPGSYPMSISATRKALDDEGLSRRMACLHLNTWMDGRDIAEVEAIAKRHRKLSRYGFEPTCLFNAVFERRCPNAEYTFYGDDTKVHSPNDIERKIAAGLPGFSTTPKAEADPRVVNWMDSFYLS